jgi:hypothetical protein
MVDSIHFEIINISQRYELMIKRLNLLNKNKEYNVLKFKDLESQKLVHIKKGRINIPSSSRYINYVHDTIRDKVSFEFSVPKALHGTNVFQFVNHIYDRYQPFNLSESVVIKNQIKRTHRRLVTFITKFIAQELLYHVVSEREFRLKKHEDSGLHIVSMRDIEILRIDFCFNRIFLSRKDCLDYLDLLKSVHKKGQRNAVNKSKFGYDTSIYLVGRYYTLKIYHKGSEFNHIRNGESDKKGLKEINRERGFEKYKIEDIQNLADKMLRYEVEYKKSGMNYIYKRRIYKAQDPKYKRFKKDALKYDSVQDKIDRLVVVKNKPAKLNLYLIKLGYNSYGDAMKGLMAELKMYKNHKNFYEKSQTQHADFFLDISPANREASEIVTDDELDNYHRKGFTFRKPAHFSTDLVQCLGSHFLKFMNEFTLKTLDESLINSDIILKTIERKNLQHQANGTKGTTLSPGMREFIRLLDTMSIDEIKEKNLYERTTFYRYKKKLESIGYVRQSLMQRNIPFGQDFAEYYMHANTDKFYGCTKCSYF